MGVSLYSSAGLSACACDWIYGTYFGHEVEIAFPFLVSLLR